MTDFYILYIVDRYFGPLLVRVMAFGARFARTFDPSGTIAVRCGVHKTSKRTAVSFERDLF